MVKTIQKLHAEHDEKCKKLRYIGEVNQKHHCSSYLIISLDKKSQQAASSAQLHPPFNLQCWRMKLFTGASE